MLFSKSIARKGLRLSRFRPLLPGVLTLFIAIPPLDVTGQMSCLLTNNTGASIAKDLAAAQRVDRTMPTQKKGEQDMALVDLLRSDGIRVEELHSRSASHRAQVVGVRWEPQDITYYKSTPVAQRAILPGRFSASSRKVSPGGLPKQRSSEILAGQLLVAALDEQDRLRAWTFIPDPRILRVESPGSTGEWQGQIIYRSAAEFSLSLPDDQSITSLRFYLPRQTNNEFVLAPLGKLLIGKNEKER